jgi:hypothetical protein
MAHRGGRNFAAVAGLPRGAELKMPAALLAGVVLHVRERIVVMESAYTTTPGERLLVGRGVNKTYPVGAEGHFLNPKLYDFVRRTLDL